MLPILKPPNTILENIISTNPYFTQYHTQRFSFIGSPQQRDGTATKDQKFLNVYPELIKSPISEGKKYYLKKRPGVGTFQAFGGGQGRGIFYWQNTGVYYTVVGATVYANTTPIYTLATSSGPVGFCEFKSDASDFLILCDGSNGYTIQSTNVVTHITDIHFPTPHVPNPVFLDGYIFLAGTATQTIHNSALQDPLTWPSDGFIDAEMFPDQIVALSKVQNYIAAVGATSIEWFYDNANSTGSPLQRNAPAVSQFGSPAPQTVQQTEKELILVGSTSAGGRTVWVIDGFQPSEIGNEPVREALDLEAGNMIFNTAFVIQCAGHKWYVLNLKAGQRTFVYDFEEKMWHEWSSGLSQTNFAFDYAADAGNGSPVLLGQSNATNSYALSPTNYTDNGVLINCTVITSKLDFDTVKRKRIYRLSLVADSPEGPTAVPMSVSWTDDDYNTYTPAQTLMLGSGYSTITQLGYMRRRAFQFVFQQPWPLRMESFELDIIQEVRR